MNTPTRGFISGLLIIGIVIVLALGSGYFLVKNQEGVSITNNPSVPTTTNEISVPGMSKYTDSDFGFSFWYPSTWGIADVSVEKEHAAYEGGIVNKRLRVSVMQGKEFTVDEFNSPTASISPGFSGSTGAGCKISYSFDAALHTWMTSTSRCDGPQTIPADISQNTMGGLHEFQGAAGLAAQFIIPLSAHNFLIVTYSGDLSPSARLNPLPFVNTFSATDPSVATPVSSA